MHDGNEDTSQLDRLYDMLSGISEDSVRIYTGMFEDTVVEAELEVTTDVFEDDDERPEAAPSAPAEEQAPETTPEPEEPAQEPLVAEEEPAPAPKPRGRKKRASIPSWDEIMFGGPTT